GRAAAPFGVLRAHGMDPEFRAAATSGRMKAASPRHETRERRGKGRGKMKLSRVMMAGVAAAALLVPAATASAEDLIGQGITMYMQMGGNAGDGATLARQIGAAQ